MKVFVVTDNKWWFEKSKIIFNEQGVKVKYFCSKLGKNLFEAELANKDIEIINLKTDFHKLIDEFDLGFSVHCKQIFPKDLVHGVTCINIHPGLNPFNRGWFPQVFSILNKMPAGATIHIMDEDIDHGSILYQKEICIKDWDTSKDVYEKILDAEFELFSENISDILSGKYTSKPMGSVGNYNSIEDYRELLELDLGKEMKLGDAIDLLRALTHAPYKNAYFMTKDKKKVHLSIEMSIED